MARNPAPPGASPSHKEKTMYPIIIFVLGVLLVGQQLLMMRDRRKFRAKLLEYVDVITTQNTEITKLGLDIRDHESAYHSLEEGADEQLEGFEAEYLSWKDQKTSFETSLDHKDQEIFLKGLEIAILQAEVEYHRACCLPDFQSMRWEAFTALDDV